jgi:hypothetical protein
MLNVEFRNDFGILHSKFIIRYSFFLTLLAALHFILRSPHQTYARKKEQ